MTAWGHLTGFLPGACRGLLQAGMGLALQSTLVLLAGLLAGRRLRRRGPAAAALAYRATALAAILGALLALAVGGRFQPRWAMALPPAEEAAHRAPAPDSAAVRGTPAMPMPRFVPAGGPGLGIAPTRSKAPRTAGVEQKTSLPLGESIASKRADMPAWYHPSLPLRTTPIGWLYVVLAGIWGAGAAALLTGLALCYRSMGRLRKESVPAGDEAMAMLRRVCETRRLHPPLLRVSPRVQSPVLVGLRRPAILLPASYPEDFDPPALRAVLAHELAHLERGDCGWLLLVRLTCAVGWVQPLGWALARRLEASSEEVCDQEVLRGDASPHAYARCLVDVAERLVPSRLERAIGAGIAPCRSALERRVRNILSSSPEPSPLTSRLRAVIMLGTLAAVGAGLLLISAAAAPPDAPVKDPLADDARLAHKVRVTVEGLPVSDLLARLSAKTGVSLVSEPDTGDDKVIVFGPARPLRELLADLAALFNDRWERKRARNGVDGYRLIRTVSARQLEANFARRTTEQMMARLERAVSGLDLKPEQLDHPENQDIQWHISDRKRRFALALYRQLSQAQREALFQSESLRIPFRALTPAQQPPVRAVFADIITEEQAFSDEKAKQLPLELGLSPPPVSQPEDLENGEIQFQLMHVDGQLSLNLQFGKRLGQGIFVTSFSTADRWLAPAHGNPYTGEPIPPGASLPEANAVRAAFGEQAWPDRLRQLIAGSGLTVMADYYRVSPITAFSVPPRPPASDEAAAALDALCDPDGYLWWVRGKTLLVRKRDWFDQQRYEVPDRWLLDVIQRARQTPLTCADVMRVLGLTDEQILGLGILFSDHGPAWQFNRAEEIGGLREYLALVNTAPRKADGRIENTQTLSSDGTTGEGFWLKYATMTPLQRRLVPGFLAAQDYPVSPAGPEQFSLFLFHVGNTPMTTPLGCKYLPFRLAWDVGGKEKISLGWSVDLPASLPDDRRDRTRIEVLL